MAAIKLSEQISLADFDNGYWYAAELKTFAQQLGIPAASKLRKDELEAAIKQLLSKGTLNKVPVRLRSKKPSTQANTAGATKADYLVGLHLKLPVLHYTSNKATKQFIVGQAHKQVPGLKERSGVRYRLNRWREEQLASSKVLTYGDLVQHYIELNQSQEPFARIPHGRYINFLADFAANEKYKSQAAALAAWHELKSLAIPKTYSAWKQHLKARS